MFCQICLFYNELYNLKVVNQFNELSTRLIQSLGAAGLLLAILYFIIPELIIETKIYALSILLIFIFIFKRTIKLFSLTVYVLFILPAFCDFILEKTGLYHDIISLRIITGALLGLAFFHLLLVSVGKREDELESNQGDNRWITSA